MIHADREIFADLLHDFGELFDRELGPGVGEQYWSELKGFHVEVVRTAAAELKRTLAKFPTIADWHKACAKASDRRHERRAEQRAPIESGPATWARTANIIRVFLSFELAKARVRIDERLGTELLGEINDELRVLREEYATPAECPTARRLAERRRIVKLIAGRVIGTAQQRADAPDPEREAGERSAEAAQ